MQPDDHVRSALVASIGPVEQFIFVQASLIMNKATNIDQTPSLHVDTY